MPELSRQGRGSGPAISAAGRTATRRLYGKADAGPTCGVCGTPMVKTLAAAGVLEHPTCDPDMHFLLTLSRAATRKAGKPGVR